MKLIIATLLTMVLFGCGSAGTKSSTANLPKHPMDIVMETQRQCLAQTEKFQPPDYYDVVHTSYTDPRWDEKNKLEIPISDQFREFLLKSAPIWRKCNSDVIQGLSRYSVEHTELAIEMVQNDEFIITEALEGNITTYGEYNRRRGNLYSKIQAKWAMANARLNHKEAQQRQQLAPQQRANLLEALQVLNMLRAQQDQLWQTQWKNTFTPTVPTYKYTPPTQTNCNVLGNHLSCNSLQQGATSIKRTVCNRTGNFISCNEYQ